MKIMFDPEAQDEWPTFFASLEEWDAFPYSPRGRAATWKEGTYQPRCRNTPTRFPCYYFEGDLIYRDNGPDEYANYFIYPA